MPAKQSTNEPYWNMTLRTGFSRTQQQPLMCASLKSAAAASVIAFPCCTTVDCRSPTYLELFCRFVTDMHNHSHDEQTGAK